MFDFLEKAKKAFQFAKDLDNLAKELSPEEPGPDDTEDETDRDTDNEETKP